MASRNTKPKSILDVGMRECKWWVSEDKHGMATLFCARPSVPGTSWCEEHLMKMTSSSAAAERLKKLVARTRT